MIPTKQKTTNLTLAIFAIVAVSCTNSNKSFVENAYDLNMKMVYVQGGTFYMGGTNEQSPFSQEDEKVRQITLDGYWIAETEITQSQWEKVMGTTLSMQRELSDGENEINGVGVDCAMYYVSWNEAKEFVRRLRDKTGLNYSLPTEAQWEFAARGGNKSQSRIYAGDDMIENVSWFSNNSDGSVHNVASKKANELGIYDMSGNVYEWCEDYYGEYEHFFGADNEKETRNPKGPGRGFDKILRGGCYLDAAEDCRVSARYYEEPDVHSKAFGFRIALIPSDADNSVNQNVSNENDADINVYEKSLQGKIEYGGSETDKLMSVGQSKKLSIRFEDDRNHKVFWTSESASVAYVDTDGTVTAVGPGATRIVAFDNFSNIIDMVSIYVEVPQDHKDAMELSTVIDKLATDLVVKSGKATTTFSGNLRNGYPHGTGTMTFMVKRRIDMHDEKGRMAVSGDYIIGEWDKGHLIQGRWYDSSNNLKETIILGKALNPELDHSLGISSKNE